MSTARHRRMLILGLHSSSAFVELLAEKAGGEVLLVDRFKPPTLNVEGTIEMKGNMRGIRLAALLGGILVAGHSAAAGLRDGWGRMTEHYNPRKKAERHNGRQRGVRYVTHTKTPGPSNAKVKRLVKKAKGKATAKARNCYRSAKK